MLGAGEKESTHRSENPNFRPPDNLHKIVSVTEGMKVLLAGASRASVCHLQGS